MSLPVHSALAPRRDRLWPAALVSAALHAVVIVWAVVRSDGADLDLDQKPIVAKLVRLGEKRPDQFLPRKEAPPPAPAATPVVAPPSPSIAAAVPSAPVPGAKPAPASTRPQPPATASTPASADRASRIASLLSSTRQRASDEPVYGDPNGDPLGDSAEGEGDQYVALVTRTLKENYDVPSTIPEKERLYLSADVVLQIDPDGKLARWKIVRPSDNPLFNSAFERTLRLTPRFPPPPPDQREKYRSGVMIQFKI